MEKTSARFDELQRKVEALYATQLAGRDGWADWLYPNHVLVVARNAKRIAEQKDADAELSQVAALLHDIADYKMTRGNAGHEQESLRIARDVMQQCGYREEDIALVVNDAIRYHSCHGAERPKSQEGLVLAAADALAHFQTDYYVFTTRNLGHGKNLTLQEIKEWALKKIDRDFNDKISFADIRQEVQPDYALMKNLFSR